MSWIDDYKRKLVGLEEAAAMVKSGDRVFLSANAATPHAMMRALAERKDELRDVELVHMLLIGEHPLAAPEMEGHFRHNTFFVGASERQAVAEGRADYIPMFLHEIPHLFYQGLMKFDVAIIQASPPDEHGFMSYGIEALITPAALTVSEKIIVQVNHQMPRVHGSAFVHVSQVDAVVEVSEPLPEYKRPKLTDVERKIGQHIATLIEDGSTLQLGIGGIPDAVLNELKDKRDIGIHSEMVSDGVVELVESGVITNARKTIHRGKIVVSFLLGSQKLYKFVHDNPIIEVLPVEYTNDPFVIAQNDKMVAINSAIEVDLTGQVCSESIGERIYSGFGGQLDFIRGAARSRDGKPIIAIPSTTQNGQISKIVPYLKKGAGVVTTRADVRYVVTEYGIADLWGKNLRQRAKALIEIAHPKFREELERAAYERKLLPKVFSVGMTGAADQAG